MSANLTLVAVPQPLLGDPQGRGIAGVGRGRAREQAARRVNAAYAIDAVKDAGGVRPAHIKDRIRALGPTVRPDLTLKPADPEAGNWVI